MNDIVKIDNLLKKYLNIFNKITGRSFILTSLWLLSIFSSFQAFAQKPVMKNGLATFIKNNLIYPSYAAHNCIQGVVNVGFKLNLKGEVYFSKVTKNVIGDLDAEALRLIRMSNKKWQVPGSHDTSSLIIVPINFAIDGRDCFNASREEINLAIAEYDKDEQLLKVVYNYYQHNDNDPANHKAETAILKIKDDLGIDEDYLRDKLNKAQQKIKQGDMQGACEDLKFIKYMGSGLADKLLAKHCK